MKNIFLSSLIAITFFSCSQKPTIKVMKTAYVDTSILMDDYKEAKDIATKYKAKSEEMDKQLQSEALNLKKDKDYFQKNAQTKGDAWAQQHYAELQKRDQQLQYTQQQMLQQLQKESSIETESLVKKVKQFIKEYGKQKGYAYIYGTGETASVLYAQDQFDITKELTKLLNEKYKNTAKASNK